MALENKINSWTMEDLFPFFASFEGFREKKISIKSYCLFLVLSAQLYFRWKSLIFFCMKSENSIRSETLVTNPRQCCSAGLL